MCNKTQLPMNLAMTDLNTPIIDMCIDVYKNLHLCPVFLLRWAVGEWCSMGQS